MYCLCDLSLIPPIRCSFAPSHCYVSSVLQLLRTTVIEHNNQWSSEIFSERWLTALLIFSMFDDVSLYSRTSLAPCRSLAMICTVTICRTPLGDVLRAPLTDCTIRSADVNQRSRVNYKSFSICFYSLPISVSYSTPGSPDSTYSQLFSFPQRHKYYPGRTSYLFATKKTDINIDVKM